VQLSANPARDSIPEPALGVVFIQHLPPCLFPVCPSCVFPLARRAVPCSKDSSGQSKMANSRAVSGLPVSNAPTSYHQRPCEKYRWQYSTLVCQAGIMFTRLALFCPECKALCGWVLTIPEDGNDSFPSYLALFPALTFAHLFRCAARIRARPLVRGDFVSADALTFE
jgi:hypothetical protein